jgi:hypothetical protein
MIELRTDGPMLKCREVPNKLYIIGGIKQLVRPALFDANASVAAYDMEDGKSVHTLVIEAIKSRLKSDHL